MPLEKLDLKHLCDHACSLWNNQFQINKSGTITGTDQSLTFTTTTTLADSNPKLIWTETETATLTYSDIKNPVYSVSINSSSNSSYSQPESTTYVYNADGSFSGQYTPQDTFDYQAYVFSFDASNGTAQGSSWDGLFTSFTYLSDGSGSGNGESETFQFSITDDGIASWDNSVNTGAYTYTDDYSTTYAGGYTETYSDSTGDSWVYAQNDDGIETV